MHIKFISSSKGFTYIAALVLVMILGIMLGAAGKSWTMIMKREREEELLFRGCQIRDAIARWNRPAPGKHQVTPLRDLKDLTLDPRSVEKIRYLRRIYKDPINNHEFDVIYDSTKGIIGVRSRSNDTPLRQSFKSKFIQTDKSLVKMYMTFEGKKKYSDWAFVYWPVP